MTGGEKLHWKHPQVRSQTRSLVGPLDRALDVQATQHLSLDLLEFWVLPAVLACSASELWFRLCLTSELYQVDPGSYILQQYRGFTHVCSYLHDGW